MAPAIWATTYAMAFAIVMWPVTSVARVTAGFKCPPEMLAVMYTASNVHPCIQEFRVCLAYISLREKHRAVRQQVQAAALEM